MILTIKLVTLNNICVYIYLNCLGLNYSKTVFSDGLSHDHDERAAGALAVDSTVFVEFDSRKNDLEMSKNMDAKSLEFYKQIQRRPYDVNCRNLIEWNEDEVRKAKRILFKLNNLNSNRAGAGRRIGQIAPENELSNSIPLLSDENYRFPASKCRLFRELRGYDRYNKTNQTFVFFFLKIYLITFFSI